MKNWRKFALPLLIRVVSFILLLNAVNIFELAKTIPDGTLFRCKSGLHLLNSSLPRLL
ncbi:hypothetical protein T4D_15873 [Trichinella pseudospiralis]|uniref:Uncharacterized protein n=1 Tax=Trichinella pseudospiralis TaxID=6337 RepID=A0A0V1FB14_TRIPS|nr:hypothetical protein T4D_15873 [Trichinella pseudospiralis]